MLYFGTVACAVRGAQQHRVAGLGRNQLQRWRRVSVSFASVISEVTHFLEHDEGVGDLT